MSNAAAKSEGGNKPSHYVYVIEGEGDDAFFTKVGALWPTRKGTGFTGKLSASPMNGRIYIGPADQEPKAA